MGVRCYRYLLWPKAGGCSKRPGYTLTGIGVIRVFYSPDNADNAGALFCIVRITEFAGHCGWFMNLLRSLVCTTQCADDRIK